MNTVSANTMPTSTMPTSTMPTSTMPTNDNNTSKSKKDLLLEAQQECNLTVAQKRIEVMKALSELEEIRGTDDYAVTITEALKAFGNPLPLAFFNQVLPDSALLVSVRKMLRGETGKPAVIEEVKAPEDKTKIVLQLIQQAA